MLGAVLARLRCGAARMVPTPSALALALTLLLALLSALAFVLIYLRSPWAASAAVARGNNKSHLHAHSHPGSHAHHNHSHGPGPPSKHGAVGGGAHAHAHTAGGGDSANSHGSSALLNGSNGNSTNGGGGGGNSNNLTALQLAALSAASSSSSSSAMHNHSSGLAPGLAGSALTAADIALRGRKAKKRGGRVHVMLGNSGNGGSSSSGGGGSSGLGSGLSSLSSSIASPASSSSRGRGNSLASPSPYVFPLDFLSVAPPVVVCLTTLPSRVHHIDKCLNSIKTQNYPIAQMMLAIPEESRRERTKYRFEHITTQTRACILDVANERATGSTLIFVASFVLCVTAFLIVFARTPSSTWFAFLTTTVLRLV